MFKLQQRLTALVLVALAGCGGSTPAGTAGMPTTMSIGAVGGTVTSADGATVRIPAGALSATTAITIGSTPGATAPASTTVVGTPVTLAPEGQQFALPVTVTLVLSPSLLPAGKAASSVVIYTAPTGSATYAALATAVVDATHVSAQVAHFSTFVPAVPAMPAGCSTNADCTAGRVCSNGVCVGGGNCVSNSDCSPGTSCVSGTCKG